MSLAISYAAALDGVVAPDDLASVLDLIQTHKQWGGGRVPWLQSHIVVNLVDEIKKLKEQQLEFYTSKTGADGSGG
jgi:hypothetical protein